MKGLKRFVVLDFSKLLPGPFCTMLLADLGCRVIRVELPRWKDPLRDVGPMIDGHGFCFWMVNRNKESLCLDFREPAGMAVLRRLLRRTDVLVEGFRPGLMARLGLGPKRIRRDFPRLVYCSITGYGQEGPLSGAAGHDINFQALSGLMGLGDSEGKVTFPAAQIADLSGSMYAALAILAALHERERTGRGGLVDISMAESIFTWQVLGLGEYFAQGKSPERKQRWWNGNSAFYRAYRTKDGRHIAVGAVERGFAESLLRELGLAGLEPGARGGYVFGEAAVERRMEAAFSRRTLREWMTRFKGKDVCATPVLRLDEAARHPFFRSRGSLQRSPTRVGRPPVVASPMRIGGRQTRPRRRPPPRLGRDNAGVLRSLGFGLEEIRRLRRSGLLRSDGR